MQTDETTHMMIHVSTEIIQLDFRTKKNSRTKATLHFLLPSISMALIVYTCPIVYRESKENIHYFELINSRGLS